MSAAYAAPLCLSCSAAGMVMESDRVAAAPPFSSGHLRPRNRLMFDLGSRPKGPRVRAPSNLSSISVAKRRRRRRHGLGFGEKVVCLTSDAPESITASSWNISVLQSEVPVLVEFWASWCGPCRMVHRVIEELARDYSGRIKLYKLDTDESPQVAAVYSVERIPTVLLFKDGEKIESMTGTLPKSVYVKAIEISLSN